ncbi:MAG: biotin/lipoyl-containing protein [Acidobacteriota bacterium]
MRRFTFIHRGSADPEEIAISLEGSRRVLTRGGKSEGAAVARLGDGRLSLLLDDGRQICGRVLPGPDGVAEVVTGNSRDKISLAEPLRDRIAHAIEAGVGGPAEEEIRALMPGRVVEVHVAEGNRVASGALILVLEAMKMQNEIRTSRSGTVARICVEAGKAVDGGSLLAVIRSEPA